MSRHLAIAPSTTPDETHTSSAQPVQVHPQHHILLYERDNQQQCCATDRDPHGPSDRDPYLTRWGVEHLERMPPHISRDGWRTFLETLRHLDKLEQPSTPQCELRGVAEYRAPLSIALE